MNDIEWNALFQQSDKGLLKARVSRVEVVMVTCEKGIWSDLGPVN